MRERSLQNLGRVLIVKALVKQYRVDFFTRLHDELLGHGVQLKVVYSAPSDVEREKGDNAELPPRVGERVPGRYLLRDRLLLQWPGFRNFLDADLIVVVNANGNLLNLPLLLLSRLGLKTVALWGHGRNHQRNGRITAREWFKLYLAKMPDWWFAYTSETAQYLASLGFHAKKITTINNAIDTSRFAAMVTTAGENELAAMRERLELDPDDCVGIYCGALYANKRIPLLIDACAMVAAREPRFRLLIVGGGGDSDLVRRACHELTFIRYAGPLFGKEKALCYKLSSMVLNPGAVGLAILDAFAAGRPFITLADSLHGPEISYLQHELNGLLVEGGTEAFAEAVTRVICDDDLRSRLAAVAAEATKTYSIEAMIKRVSKGILDCLAQSGRGA